MITLGILFDAAVLLSNTTEVTDILDAMSSSDNAQVEYAALSPVELRGSRTCAPSGGPT